MPLGVGLEPRGAVAEAAVGVRERARALEHADPDPHLRDGLRDLLAVGADVLDRGGADQAGDAGERLDADPLALHGPRHEVLPALPRRHRDHGASAGRVVALDVGPHSAGGDLDDGAVEAVVRDHDVAPAAEHEDRPLDGAHRLDQLRLRGRAHPRAGRPAQSQRRVLGEQLCHLRGHERRPWACRAPSARPTSPSAPRWSGRPRAPWPRRRSRPRPRRPPVRRPER